MSVEGGLCGGNVVESYGSTAIFSASILIVGGSFNCGRKEENNGRGKRENKK